MLNQKASSLWEWYVYNDDAVSVVVTVKEFTDKCSKYGSVYLI
jgi:hypothetical protein